jgi:hypothetical protein
MLEHQVVDQNRRMLDVGMADFERDCQAQCWTATETMCALSGIVPHLGEDEVELLVGTIENAVTSDHRSSTKTFCNCHIQCQVRVKSQIATQWSTGSVMI